MSLSDCPNCWETPCACPVKNDDGWGQREPIPGTNGTAGQTISEVRDAD